MQTKLTACASLLCACLLGQSATADGHIDLTDPNATAVAVIEAFRAKDGPAFGPLVNEVNARFATMVADMPADDPEWDDLFSSWRQQGLDVWDGTILPAKQRGDDPMTLTVPFALSSNDVGQPLSQTECAAPCRYLVIVLTRDSETDTTWGFEDINGRDLSAYDADPAFN
ncbi:hypothetical protein [Yoonia sp. 208BN28-4]|uniref:hypothetical protein n=1 Tax=Yoonia sp. 208BN28-4 TaxID=3126505 RepID=UPI0030A09D63